MSVRAMRGVSHVGWRTRAAFGSVLLATMLRTTAAWAHMMPAQQGTLNVIDNAVFAALSVPCSALRGVDDNHDGRLSADEVRAGGAKIQAQLIRGLRFFDGRAPGRVDLVIPIAEPDERDPTSTAGSRHLLVLIKSTFAATPASLRIEIDLFGQTAAEQQITFKATRGADTEAAILSPHSNAHAFFQSPQRVVREYIALGLEHVLLGTDHLLFLLTIIVAVAGWRYWLGVLTSFTIAHSMTLTLALLGLLRVRAGFVEPLIAASIVLMALLNLRQRQPVASQRMVIVFACGLLHGLGFASAMTDLGLHGAHRALSIVGFNVGIELGQALFLGVLLGVSAGWRSAVRLRRRLPRADALGHITLERAASWSATVLGTFWLVERLRA